MKLSLNTNNQKKTKNAWEKYYKGKKHNQEYPDEMLIRLLQGLKPGSVLDLGCGKGRHLALLKDYKYSPIYANDISPEALKYSCHTYPFVIPAQTHDKDLEPNFSSFLDNSLDLVVAWGVLHYNPISKVEKYLEEIQRVLKKKGYFIGTLRSTKDTHLQKNQDIRESLKYLYTKTECSILLEKYFQKVKLGHIERTLLDDLESKIAHWFFCVQN